MLAPVDLLKAVARHGPLTSTELDVAVPALEDGVDDGFLAALDACVETGYLALRWKRGAPVEADTYRLTPRARRLLRATARACRAA